MTDPDYFDGMYARSSDPWGLGESHYELRKYAVTIASLPRPTYRRAFEPGCSIGVLTELLAARCEELVATDLVDLPLQVAGRRTPGVEFARGAFPHDWPEGSFDLVVLSELLYFLSAADRRTALERIADSLEPGGHLVAVHWRHEFDEAACGGEQAHEELRASTAWQLIVQHLERDFRLEVFERVAP